MTVPEEWRVIDAFPDYAVSSHGQVKRVVADQSWRLRRPILNGTITAKGYRQVALWRDGVASVAMVHRLVCAAFHGTPPSPEHVAAHTDGNSINNHAANLRWATHLENEHDKRLHGTVARGERQGAAKLTEEAVASIRADGRSQRKIAADYGVTQANISSLMRRKTWGHVA